MIFFKTFPVNVNSELLSDVSMTEKALKTWYFIRKVKNLRTFPSFVAIH